MDLLSKICIRVSIIIDNDCKGQGSGFIIQQNDKYYVITAEHCIHGRKGEFKDQIDCDSIKIEYQEGEDYASAFKTMTVISITDCSNDEKDWALLEIETPSFILEKIPKIEFNTNLVDREVKFMGYQEENADEKRVFKGTILRSSKRQGELKINSKTSTNQGSLQGVEVFGGLSGSGVFIECKETHQLYLIGIIKSLVGVNNDVKCCSITALERVLGKDYSIAPKLEPYDELKIKRKESRNSSNSFNLTTRLSSHKLASLFARLKKEYNSESIIQTFNSLEKYTTRKDTIGLEEKLCLAEKSYLYEDFSELKQAFSKKLMFYQNYESAQEIFVFILAAILEKYRNIIKPMLRENETERNILNALSSEIIAPLLNLIQEEGADDIMGLSASEIEGMFHYLTGNCHIKWKL